MTHQQMNQPAGQSIQRWGLTGGIASGKSAVTGMLAKRGAVIVDHDVLAHQVVAAGTQGLRQIAESFGQQIVTPAGELDRQALAGIVFHDSQERERLNQIVHPLVRHAADDADASAPAGSIVVHDIPLLIETGQGRDFDLLIVVDIPYELQLSRLMARNGLTKNQAEARINAQAHRSERLALADIVIDNSGDLAATQRQIDELWQRYR